MGLSLHDTLEIRFKKDLWVRRCLSSHHLKQYHVTWPNLSIRSSDVVGLWRAAVYGTRPAAAPLVAALVACQAPKPIATGVVDGSQELVGPPVEVHGVFACTLALVLASQGKMETARRALPAVHTGHGGWPVERSCQGRTLAPG